MDGLDLKTEAGQDALVVQIHTLAHQFVQEELGGEADAEDAASDVVLWCLEQLRDGTWDIEGRALEAHVACLVRRRAKVRRRQRRRWMSRDMERVRDTEGSVKEWMEPGVEMDAAQLGASYATALGKLSPACRRVYELVRGEDLSYAAAAERLGVGVETIKTRMKQAQKVFQAAMGKRRGPRGWIAYEPPAQSAPKRGRGRRQQNREAAAATHGTPL